MDSDNLFEKTSNETKEFAEINVSPYLRQSSQNLEKRMSKKVLQKSLTLNIPQGSGSSKISIPSNVVSIEPGKSGKNDEVNAPTPANTPSTRVPAGNNPFSPPTPANTPSTRVPAGNNPFSPPTPANTPSTRVPAGSNPFSPPTQGKVEKPKPKVSFDANALFDGDDSDPEELDIDVKLDNKPKKIEEQQQPSFTSAVASLRSNQLNFEQHPNDNKDINNEEDENNNLDSIEWNLVYQSEYNVGNSRKNVILFTKIVKSGHHSSKNLSRTKLKNFFKLSATDGRTKHQQIFYIDCPSDINISFSSSFNYKPILDRFVQEQLNQSFSSTTSTTTNSNNTIIYQCDIAIQGGPARVTISQNQTSNGLLFDIKYFSGKIGFEQFIEKKRFISAGLVSSFDSHLSNIDFNRAILLFFGNSVTHFPQSHPHPHQGFLPQQPFHQQNTQINTVVIVVSVIVSLAALCVALLSSRN